MGGNHQRGINAGLGARGRRAGFGDKSGGSRRRQPEAGGLARFHRGSQGHAGSWGQHAARGGPAQPPPKSPPLTLAAASASPARRGVGAGSGGLFLL